MYDERNAVATAESVIVSLEELKATRTPVFRPLQDRWSRSSRGITMASTSSFAQATFDD